LKLVEDEDDGEQVENLFLKTSLFKNGTGKAGDATFGLVTFALTTFSLTPLSIITPIKLQYMHWMTTSITKLNMMAFSITRLSKTA